MRSDVMLEKDSLGYSWARWEQTAGLGLLAIGLSANGSYFAYERPLSVVWADRGGSVAKYLAILPYSERYRQQVRDGILGSLYNDFSDRPDEACKLLQPLLVLFDNGVYTFDFSNAASKRFFSRWQNGNQKYLPFALEFAMSTNKSQEQEVLKACNYDIRTSRDPRHIEQILLTYSTYNFWDAYYIGFIATQPKESIDEARVRYFENEIQTGKRPFIIVFERDYFHAETGEDWDSACYLIDGHHKLLAYEKLQIFPPVLRINSRVSHAADIHFDTLALKQALFSWQYEHLIRPEEED